MSTHVLNFKGKVWFLVPVENSGVWKAPSLLRGLRNQPLNPGCQLSPWQERSLPFVFSLVASLPASPPSPQRQASFLSQEGGEEGGLGTGWNLIRGFWETAQLPGLMLERKGGSRVAPVSGLSPAECGAQQSPAPPSTNKASCRGSGSSQDSRASTPQPLPPFPVGTHPQTSMTSWAEEPLRAHSCFLCSDNTL